MGGGGALARGVLGSTCGSAGPLADTGHGAGACLASATTGAMWCRAGGLGDRRGRREHRANEMNGFVLELGPSPRVVLFTAWHLGSGFYD